MLVLNDVVTQRQTQPGSITGRLGRKEGFKKLGLELLVDSRAIVPDANFDVFSGDRRSAIATWLSG
jgi:hypothetical protein